MTPNYFDIIPDKVSIINENRYISYFGYNQLSSGNNLGISLLNSRISKNKTEVNISKIIGFYGNN